MITLIFQLELKEIMEQNRNELNNIMPAYSKVTDMDEEFAKTPKKSIKRYLYK